LLKAATMNLSGSEEDDKEEEVRMSRKEREALEAEKKKQA
jgi:hypothetical protein